MSTKLFFIGYVIVVTINLWIDNYDQWLAAGICGLFLFISGLLLDIVNEY